MRRYHRDLVRLPGVAADRSRRGLWKRPMPKEESHDVPDPRSASIAALVLFALAGSPVVAAAAPSKTLDNLMAAFNGESNAQAKYLEFAKKADQEGFAGAAALFRAAAKAEETHARTHGEVIAKLGGAPKADIKLPEIKTTADNLKAALEGETYERDKMYPEFIAEARARETRTRCGRSTSRLRPRASTPSCTARRRRTCRPGRPSRHSTSARSAARPSSRSDFAKCPVCFTPGEKYIKVL